ncbi:MAG: hypothetical protein J6V06_06725 [Clostridia bacterium]|nr:hypothetical protein [Clostridia bacterium]
MTVTKKLLSFILAIIICITSVPFAFATDADINTDETINQEITLPEDENLLPDEGETVPDTDVEPDTETTPDTEPDKPEESRPLQDNDIVATLYVFYDKSDIHGMGHTWIYIENLTDQDLKVGAYTLPPDEGVSVGTLPEYDGWGLYYNIEAYQQGIYGMEDQLSMKEDITLKKLRRVSNFIVSYPNFWDPVFFNCMLFAFFAWDMGSWKILIPLFFPIIGKIQMLIYPPETGTLMKPVTKDKVYRQTGMFGWAELMPYDT